MDANLHVQQALNHLQRILGYYPFIQDGNEASVWLTFEDWHVLADMLFHMGDPTDVMPEAVQSYSLDENGRTILLQTADCLVRVEMTG